MNDIKELETRLEEQINSIDKIEDLGISQISTRVDNLNAILYEADSVVKKVLSSVNRNEDGTLVARDEIQYNSDELADFFSTNKKIIDLIANMKEKLAIVADSKRKLAFPVVSRMQKIKLQIKNNEEIIIDRQERMRSLREMARRESLNDELKQFLKDKKEFNYLKKILMI